MRKALLILIVGTVLAGWGWYRYTYPYGWSHCCSLILGSTLQIYANDHDGFFPRGGDTPEASLSLLYSNYLDADILRGKIVPLKVVQQTLEKNGKLTPESCGWHYVEGLTEADDPQIAVVWDKVGLGHNGEREKNGAHEVILVDGSREFIPAAEWPDFLTKQKSLLAARDSEAVKGLPALTATIHLPSGQILNHYEGAYELASIEKAENSSGHGTESGSNLQLRWYHFVPDGQITLTLTLPKEGLRSKPVSFQVKNGRATPSVIVFEMEKY